VKRALLAVVLLLAGAAAVDQLGDSFQSRADHMSPDSRSEITLRVSADDYKGDPAQAADAIVAACRGSVRNRVLDDPGVVEVEPGTYRFSVQPGLGKNNRVKLVGCLQDLTIDRIQASVVSVDTAG
jgi:hypothetical protein